MKTIYKEKIGEKTYIRFITDTTPDREATLKKIEPLITPETTEEELENLINDNLEPAKYGPEAELIEDGVAEQLQQKLDAMGKYQQLLDNGEYDPDYRGVEYWVQKSGKWEKDKIEEIGIKLPAGAVLPESLTQKQQVEIASQQEAQRIAGLTTEEKVAEKQVALNNLADEADKLDRRAKIQQQIFDPIIWYREQAGAIEAKYA